MLLRTARARDAKCGKGALTDPEPECSRFDAQLPEQLNLETVAQHLPRNGRWNLLVRFGQVGQIRVALSGRELAGGVVPAHAPNQRGFGAQFNQEKFAEPRQPRSVCGTIASTSN